MLKLQPKLVVLALLAFATVARAQPYALQYGGRITDAIGKPVEGSVVLRAQFFRDETGTAPIPVTLPDFPVTLNAGVFQLAISMSDTDFNTVFNGTDQVWIQVKNVTHNKIYPRQAYGVVPYALKVPVDGDSIEFNADGQLRLKAPALTNKYLKTDGAGGVLWVDLAAGTGDMVTADYDSTPGDSKVDAAASADVAANALQLNGKADAFFTNAANIPETATRKWLSDTERAKLTGLTAGADMLKSTYDTNNDGKVNSAVVADSATTATTATNATQLNGQAASFYTNATNITAGELADARIPAGIARDSEIAAAARASVSGTAPVDYNGGTGAFSMQPASGTVNGYLSSSNWTTFNGKQPAIGAASNITLNTLVAKGDIRLDDDDATAGVTIKAKDVTTSSYVLTLPDNAGAVGQFMTTDGSGALSWTSPSSGGDMFKATYDIGNNGKVDNADSADNALLLGGNNAAFFQNAANLTGTIADARIPAGIARDVEIPATTDALAEGATNKYMTTAEKTKLGGIEALADVTDAANVDAAGAVMNGDFGSNGLMSRTGVGAYSVVADNSANWDLAFGWGNHGAAGYLTSVPWSAPSNIGSITPADGKFVTLTGANIIAKGDLTLEDDDASAVVTIKANDTTTASYTLTLPAAVGGNGQLLSTNASGVLSWVSAGAGGDMLAGTYDNTGFPGVVDDAEKLDGQPASFYRDAGNLTGTIADARIPAGIARDIEIPTTTDNLSEGSTNKYMTAAEKTKLNGIAAGADVTNSTNVESAGAVMDGDYTANGILARNGASGAYTMVTNNSANWNTAYTDRFKWDGGATGLVQATARTSLGLVPGTDVQAYSVRLSDVAGLTPTDNNFIVGNGANFVAESGATARTSLGLGTMATQAASAVAITGGTIAGTTFTTPSFSNDAISGDKVDGGTISNFASTGIDDNSDALAITIDSSERVGIGIAPSAPLTVMGGGTGATVANSGTTDATMNQRACRGSVCIDTGMLDNGVGYTQVRSIGNFATTFGLALNPTGGNVGVGTISPTSPLTVVNNDATTTGGANAHVAIANYNSTDNNMAFTSFRTADTAATQTVAARIGAVFPTHGVGATTGELFFSTAPNSATLTERMRIDSTGRVGIGTDDPQHKLDIQDAATPRLNIVDTTNNTTLAVLSTDSDSRIGTTSTHPMYFLSDNQMRMSISETGNVGVGLWVPNASAKLDVSSTTQGLLPPRMTTAQRDAIVTPAKGLVVYNTTTDKLNVYNGATWGVPNAAPDYFWVVDEKTTGTNGGASVAAWTTRALNLTLVDVGSNIVSVASNIVTVKPGTYDCEATAPARSSNGHFVRLFNVTAGTILGRSGSGNSSVANDPITAQATFTVAVNTGLRIDHIVKTAQANDGWGQAANIAGENEWYASLGCTRLH